MTSKTINKSFIVAIASGKGGVGKSVVTVNLAESLVKMGHSVALVDADLGLSNCAALVNENAPGTVVDVMRGKSDISDIIVQTKGGYTMVTGADEPDAEHLDWSVLYPKLDQVLRMLRKDHDFILVDTPAGASDLSFWALDRADMGILIVVGEPTAISDVYRFCKFVLEIDPTYPFAALVNFAENEEDARNVLNRFNTIVNHFMKREFPYLGFLPMDDMVRKSVSDQIPFVRTQVDSAPSKEVGFIAGALVGLSNNEPLSKVTAKPKVDA